MLDINKLTFEADGKKIIDEISLNIKEGETLVITGPNGSGKTSLMKLVMGIEEATSGEICFGPNKITNLPIDERARLGISYAFQRPVRIKGMTVRQFLNLSAKRELSDEELKEVINKVGLKADEYIEREIDDKLSGGEMKRIEIISTLLRDVKLNIFDEPEAGIDLWSFKNLISVFKDLKEKRNGTIVIVSHQERILDIADRIAVIRGGKLAEIGTREEIFPKLSEGESASFEG